MKKKNSNNNSLKNDYDALLKIFHDAKKPISNICMLLSSATCDNHKSLIDQTLIEYLEKNIRENLSTCKNYQNKSSLSNEIKIVLNNIIDCYSEISLFIETYKADETTFLIVQSKKELFNSYLSDINKKIYEVLKNA